MDCIGGWMGEAERDSFVICSGENSSEKSIVAGVMVELRAYGVKVVAEAQECSYDRCELEDCSNEERELM
jgi:hypothetical protein